MDVPDPVKRSGSFFTCTLIDVEPGRDRRMDVEVACVCAVPAMDFFRLSGGEPEDGVGCNGERLDLGSRVIPRVLAVTGRVEGDIRFTEMVVVGVIVDIILVQGDQISKPCAGFDQGFHPHVASFIRGRGQVCRERVVVAAALPVMNDRDASVDPVTGKDLEVPGDIGVLSPPDVQHNPVGKRVEERRRGVGDVGKTSSRCQAAEKTTCSRSELRLPSVSGM